MGIVCVGTDVRTTTLPQGVTRALIGAPSPSTSPPPAGILEGISRIEADAYRLMADLGASPRVHQVRGGGRGHLQYELIPRGYARGLYQRYNVPRSTALLPASPLLIPTHFI